MSFLSRLFGRGSGQAPDADAQTRAARPEDDEEPPESVADPAPDEHRVVVWVRLSDPEMTNDREQFRLFGLADRVMRAVAEAEVGVYETNDLERGFFRMHIHGADADRLVAVVAPIVAGCSPGSYIAKRAGPSGTSEERVDI